MSYDNNTGHPTVPENNTGSSAHNSVQATRVSDAYANGGNEHTQKVATTRKCMEQATRWLLHKNKVPHYTNGRKRTATGSPQDIAQLDTYENAIRQLNTEGYDGLGFALGVDDSGNYWQGIDLDKIEENNNGSIAQLIVSMEYGYKELSLSKAGLHAIGYGEKFKTLGSNGSGTEAYCEGRFFADTGTVINDMPIGCLKYFVETELVARHKLKANQTTDQLHNAAKPDLNTTVLHTEDKGTNSGTYAEFIYTPPPPADVATVIINDKQVTDLRSALTFLRSDDRDIWVNCGMALKELGPQGRELWLTWSQTSTKYDPSQAAKTWDSFKPNHTGYPAIFEYAQNAGWVNPANKKSKISDHESTVENHKTDLSVRVDLEEPELKKTEFIFDPYIPKGFAIGFYGRGESAKSSFASTIAADISNFYSTLWITSEESEDYIIKRHYKSQGENGTIATVSENNFDLNTQLEDAVAKSKQKLSKPLGLIILDAVSGLVTWPSSGGANDDATVKKLLSFLNRIAEREGLSIILIGHTRKGQGVGELDVRDGVLGSGAWTSSLRYAYMLRKVHGEDYSGFIRQVKNNTGQNFGQHYYTSPVHTLGKNTDNVESSLCKVIFSGDRIYGEGILDKAWSDCAAQNLMPNQTQKKDQEVEEIIELILQLLVNSKQVNRAQVKEVIGFEIKRTHWKKVDIALSEFKINIRKGQGNTVFYESIENDS